MVFIVIRFHKQQIAKMVLIERIPTLTDVRSHQCAFVKGLSVIVFSKILGEMNV